MKIFTISNDNPYHVNRMEIAETARLWDCDIGTASRRWADHKGVPCDDKLTEFENYVRFLQSITNIGNNLVKKYFAGQEIVIPNRG